MKIKYLFYSLAILFSSYTVTAQTKVGTVNINVIVTKLPEIGKVKTGIEDYEKQLQNDLKLKLEAYEKEVEAANKVFATMDDEARKKKQQDIFNLETDIQKFRQNAADLVQLKQEELMRPLFSKVGQAVSEIAKQEKYTQIFTLDGNELAYIDPLYDLTLKVAEKLGITLK